MSTLDTALHDHATRLLIGTNLTPADAQALAADSTPTTTALAAAVRDGWRVANDGGVRP